VRSTTASHKELVNTLQGQIASLEAELAAVNGNLESLRASQNSDTDAASTVEREALLKAQSDFAAIKAETEALQEAHSKALEEALQKAQEYEEKASKSIALEKQVAELLAEKEESANKVSELEIEILEMKESQEGDDDAKTELQAKLSSIQAELAAATAATQKALDDAQAKDTEHLAQSASASELHEQALQTASSEQEKLAVQLAELKEQLSQSLAANERASTDAKAALEAHAQELAEAENSFLAKKTDLTDEIQRITAELEVCIGNQFSGLN